MTLHKRRGVLPGWEQIPLSSGFGRGSKLLVMALVAAGVALLLSTPGMQVWAWHQSPVSSLSPVPTQPDQFPTPTPKAPLITPTPAPATPVPADDQLSQSSERGTALLVAGGIVLAGLIVGALVLLVRGQPPDEPTP